MKKILIGIWAVVIGLAANGVLTQSVFAEQAEADSIEQTILMDEENSTSTGRVRGDVICFNSKKCTIEGVVEGDVLAASNEIEINAEVTGSVRAAAFQKVVLSGQTIVHGNVSIAASNIVIGEESKLWGDAILITGKALEMNGIIGRDLMSSSSEQVTIAGSVGRNAKITTKQLDILESAMIGENLDHTTQDSRIADGVVLGNVFHERLEENQQKTVRNASNTMIIWIMMVGVLMLLVLVFRPERLKEFAQKEFELKNIFLVAIGYGTVILVPIAAALLMVTIVAIPASIVIFAGWVMMLIMSLPVGLYYVIVNSCAILGKKGKLWHVAGLVIYGLLTPVAVIGWVLNVVLFGLGAGIIVKMITSSLAKKTAKVK